MASVLSLGLYEGLSNITITTNVNFDLEGNGTSVRTNSVNTVGYTALRFDNGQNIDFENNDLDLNSLPNSEAIKLLEASSTYKTFAK
jgi:hypothetical protein